MNWDQNLRGKIDYATEKNRVTHMCSVDDLRGLLAEMHSLATEIERLRTALTDARDGLRNDFEPDNQSHAYKRADAALAMRPATLPASPTPSAA